MSRIEPVTTPYSPALAERFARILPPGMVPPAIYRAVARNEGLFLHLVDSGLLGPTGLLDRRALPPRLRELLILRTCVAAGNEYEWQLHVETISQRMGLTPAEIAATRESAAAEAHDQAERAAMALVRACWSEAEAAAIALVDALVQRLAVDDALYARLREHFDEAQLIEMTQLVGLYTGVAMLVALARPDRDGYANKK